MQKQSCDNVNYKVIQGHVWVTFLGHRKSVSFIRSRARMAAGGRGQYTYLRGHD
jgi:hypothetical protein